MKVELSPYKALCFTETYLDDKISSCVYFPDKFVMYRCDRKVQSGRRAGGVAILIHHEIKSKPITIAETIDNEQNNEFLVIELCLKPKHLIIYLFYMSVFNYNYYSITNKSKTLWKNIVTTRLLCLVILTYTMSFGHLTMRMKTYSYLAFHKQRTTGLDRANRYIS